MADTEGTKEEGEDDKAISANQGFKGFQPLLCMVISTMHVNIGNTTKGNGSITAVHTAQQHPVFAVADVLVVPIILLPMAVCGSSGAWLTA